MKSSATESIIGDGSRRVAHRRLFMALIPFALALLLASLSLASADVYTYVSEGGEPLYTNTRAPGAIKVRFPLALGKKTIAKTFMHKEARDFNYDPVIMQASKQFAVDPDLVRAVIKVESNYNHVAVSPKGASGLMQLMPGTARDMGVADPFDPVANIHGGVMYLRRLLDILEGDLPLSLAAYNAGLERVKEKKGIPAIPETRKYIRLVLENYEKLKGH
jgi:soluble lytic murein transglycosylase-like protein